MKDHNGPRLKVLHLCTDQAITQALEQMELTAAQGRILCFLAHSSQPPCPKDIEQTFCLSHPTVSGLLARLEKKEFIRICPDAQDKRCKRIHMLPKGEVCHQRMHQVIQDTEQRMVRGFTPEEKRLLTALLDRAICNMGANVCNLSPKEENKP